MDALPQGRIADLAARGNVAAVLTIDAEGGSHMHRYNGTRWASVDLPGRASTVALSDEATFAGTDGGLWRVDADGTKTKLHKRSTFRLASTTAGLVVASAGKSSRDLDIARVEGAKVTPLQIKVGRRAQYAVSSSGYLATVDKNGLVIAAPGAPSVRCDVGADADALDVDASGRVWVGAGSKIVACVGSEATTIRLDGAAGLDSGIRDVQAFGAGLDPAIVAQ